MPEHSINPEDEESEEESKLAELRREAMVGEEAYLRGEPILIEDSAALDQFFAEIALEVGKR